MTKSSEIISGRIDYAFRFALRAVTLNLFSFHFFSHSFEAVNLGFHANEA